jgi:hypothetical protein
VQSCRHLDEVRREELERRRLPREWMPAGDQFVRDDAPGVDVRTRVHLVAGCLLGCHVGRCSERRPELRERGTGGFGCGLLVRVVARGPDGLGNPEVRYHRRATGQQDILGFDVAVHYAVRMRIGERARDIAEDTDRLTGGKDTGIEAGAQGGTVHEGHRVERQPFRRSSGQHRDDIRLLQPRSQSYLAGEPLGAQLDRDVGTQHFHHHLPVERRVGGDEDMAHPPAAKLALEGVGRAE